MLKICMILVLMYLSLYTDSLFSSFLIKLLILFHISEKNFNISLSLTKRFMYLLFLSKYLAYAFIGGSFTHNGGGKTLPLCLYEIKYLNESLLYDYLCDNTISSISTSLILMALLFL